MYICHMHIYILRLYIYMRTHTHTYTYTYICSPYIEEKTCSQSLWWHGKYVFVHILIIWVYMYMRMNVTYVQTNMLTTCRGEGASAEQLRWVWRYGKYVATGDGSSTSSHLPGVVVWQVCPYLYTHHIKYVHISIHIIYGYKCRRMASMSI